MTETRTSASATPAAPGLERRLGAGGLGVAVFNTVVGAGIYVLPATLAGAVGAFAPIAYLACALVMGAVALCFAAAGSRVPASGGPYAYVEAAFGPLAGFVVGVFIWLGAVLGAAGIAAALADGAARLWPTLASPLARAILLAFLFLTPAAVNLRGARRGVGLVLLLTVIKLAPLLLLVALALPRAHLAWLMPGRFHAEGFGRAMILAAFAFQGMETALGVSGEVRRPERNVPLGLLGAMAAVGVLYIALQVAAQGVLGPGLAATHAPLIAAMGAVAPSLVVVMTLGALVSMGGYLASDALSAPRLLYAFAREGLLPRVFARVGAQVGTKGGAPTVAIAVHAGLAFLLAVSGGFEELVLLSSLTTVVVYIIGCAAAVRLQRRGVATQGPPLRVEGLTLAAAIGIAGMAYLLANAKPAEALGCLAAAVIAGVWYLIARRGLRAGARRA